MSADKRAEVTNEALFETLKAIQATLDRHGDNLREIKERLGRIALLSSPVGLQVSD